MNAPFATSPRLPPTVAQRTSCWQRLCRGWSRDQLLQLLLLLLGIALLTGGLLLPLLTMLQKSLQDENGLWVGLSNFGTYFDSPIWGAPLATPSGSGY